MHSLKYLLPVAILALAGCGGGSGATASLSGSAAIGVSSGDEVDGVRYGSYGGSLGGPPPGRTSSERQARKDYYRGPRGDEF